MFHIKFLQNIFFKILKIFFQLNILISYNRKKIKKKIPEEEVINGNSILFFVFKWMLLNLTTFYWYNLLTSINSGWIVVECIPSLWKNSFTCSAIFMYSDKFLHLIWAEAIIRSPANCHTWNSCTAKTPSTFSSKRCWMAST